MDYISVLVNLIIAIIVAVVASRLAVKGFYRQEIWLRKEQKYSEIIEELNIIQKHYGDWVDEIIGATRRENDDLLTISEYRKSKRELELISQDGFLVIDNEIADILRELFKSSEEMTLNEQQGDVFGYADRMYAETRDSKIKIINIARKDLGL